MGNRPIAKTWRSRGLETGTKAMPLTKIQSETLSLISGNRGPESHLAGATGIHMSPKAMRFSHDLDLFHDTEEAVATAYRKDSEILEDHGYKIDLLLSQPGFIRAHVSKRSERLLIDWARDSVWRFFPVVPLEDIGWVLHPVDLAVNKVLTLIGREEARDFLDALYLHEMVLPLGALIWAATGKDPGLNPGMLLEMLRRKGHIEPDAFRRLDLIQPTTVEQFRPKWSDALKSAKEWIRTRPAEEAGCLYTDPDSGLVMAPTKDQSVNLLWGKAYGVLPKINNLSINSFSDSPEMRLSLESFFQKRLSK